MHRFGRPGHPILGIILGYSRRADCASSYKQRSKLKEPTSHDHLLNKKTPEDQNLQGHCVSAVGHQAYSASVFFIFFMAATSICRMRSALTPYTTANSCSVMPPELSSLTLSQRSSTMRRLRSSSASSAVAMPSLASTSRWCASIISVGSCRVSVK